MDIPAKHENFFMDKRSNMLANSLIGNLLYYHGMHSTMYTNYRIRFFGKSYAKQTRLENLVSSSNL